MGRYLIFVILLMAACFIASGCETVPKKEYRQDVSDIKSRIDTLESRMEGVEIKQSETEQVSPEQRQAAEEMKPEKAAGTNIGFGRRHQYSKEWVNQIQTCLKNAGFYDGPTDGIKGRKTKSAIRKFQGSNGLAVDGVVGPKTWELLSKYSEGKAASAGEGAAGPDKEGAATK